MLGIDVSATLVHNVLRAARVPPAPKRDRLDWRSFVRQHAATTLGCDFLTVDTVLLRRVYVLVFICIGSRRIEYIAATTNPDGRWMAQQARNLLMDLDDRGRRPRFLVHDRDAKFSRAFEAVFHGEGTTVITTPVRAPNANAPHRALGRQPPARVPGPAAHPQPPPAPGRTPGLCPPLQRAAPSPCTRSPIARPAPDALHPTPAHQISHRAPTTRPARRPHPRIRSHGGLRPSKCTPRRRRDRLGGRRSPYARLSADVYGVFIARLGARSTNLSRALVWRASIASACSCDTAPRLTPSA
jgi:hypothetical protein